jgi:ParB-like chromosome segregation protein Spo0J
MERAVSIQQSDQSVNGEKLRRQIEAAPPPSTNSEPAAATTKQLKSWRDVLPIHPAADFPLMSESELRELGEDIKKRGLISPIIVACNGDHAELLDGCNRLDAMELVGITLDLKACFESNVFQTIPDDADPYEYVLAANVHRRHLTGEQKRELIAKVLKTKPAASNRQIAKQVKADDKTVASVRRDLESTAEIPQLEKTTGKDGKTRRACKPAKAKPATTESAEVSIEQRQADHAQLADDGKEYPAANAKRRRGATPGTELVWPGRHPRPDPEDSSISDAEFVKRQFLFVGRTAIQAADDTLAFIGKIDERLEWRELLDMVDDNNNRP